MKPRHDGMVEYISRSARIQLLAILLQHAGSVREVASLMKISHTAVERWLDVSGSHPSNRNLARLLELAFYFDERKTIEILREDLRAHRNLLKTLSGNRGVATSDIIKSSIL